MVKQRHKLLIRQLKKFGVDASALADQCSEFDAFLDSISNAYTQADEDRYLGERSLDESTRELNARIAETKVANTKVIQAGKMASLGTLASGVAHELNNPLAAIKGFTELLQSENKADPKIEKRTTTILKQVTRMTSIINHLRKLARETTEKDNKDIPFMMPLKEALELLHNKLMFESITVNVQNADSDILIKGDAVRLESVFQNLLINSHDAFLSNSMSGNRQIDISLSVIDNSAIFSYSDNAGGIRPETLTRIFDPFFTTKEVGQGTGLGLAISRQIIEEHGGTINATSTQGVGTKFTITMPILQRDRSVGSIGDTVLKNVGWFARTPTSRKKLLLVDDEPALLEILAEVFEDLFEITICESGEDALVKIAEGSFDILMTDIKMPNTSGIKVANGFRAIFPDKDIILMSGHLVEQESPELKTLEPYLFLNKPFDELGQVKQKIIAYIEGHKPSKMSA